MSLRHLFLLFLIVFPSIVWGDSNSSNSQLLIQEQNGTNSGRYRVLKVTNGTTTNNGDGSISITTGSGGGGGTPSLPFNSVQFNNAGSFGGSAGFIFVSPNIGIGSANPGQILDVQGTVRALAFIGTGTSFNTFAGNVGIGSTAPGQTLDIQGIVRTAGRVYLAIDGSSVGINTQNPQDILDIHGGSIRINPISGSALMTFRNNDSEKGLIGYISSTGDMNYSQDPSALAGLNVNSSNNIGIGLTNPGQALDVNGTVRMTGFTMNNGSSLNTKVLTSDASGNGTWQTASGGGSGTVNSGTTGQGAYYASSTTAVSGTSSIFFSGNLLTSNIGIGSANPGKLLDIQGTVRISSPGSLYIANGNVGIGTTFIDGAGGGALAVMNGNVGIGTWLPAASLNIVGTGNNIFSTNVGIGTLTAGATFVVSGTGNNFIGANLGVGQKVPGVELDVQGTVRFTKSLLNTTSSTGIGWSEHNATNQACNTTCGTSACVMGLDIGTVGVINSGFVACTDATADDCICAGP